jgi:hypothetical protein
MGVIESLYDPYIHTGSTSFTYGEPFSYFSHDIHKSENVNPNTPGVSDLNKNAREFSPRSPPPGFENVFRPINNVVYIPLGHPVPPGLVPVPNTIAYSKTQPPRYVYQQLRVNIPR